ncbi:Endoglucanase precursor [compost metagenome]
MLVVKLAGEQPSGKDSGFKDVRQGSWYAGYVAAAKEKGLISGLSESSFGPNQPITRQELATILVRMQGQTLANAEDGAASTSNRVLKDREQVSDWAADYVEAAIQSGLMSGDGDYFHPQQQVTREMAAVVIVKMYEMINP